MTETQSTKTLGPMVIVNKKEISSLYSKKLLENR